MKSIVRFLGRAAIPILFVGTPCNAEPQLIATRVINLSSQNIVAFSIVGLPFRDVGLEAGPGDPLTPDFGVEGQMDYEFYWRLQDGNVHGARVDLRVDLPFSFYGDVAITIHDDHVAVSWFNMDSAWVEYSRVGDPKKVPQPTGTMFPTCEGEILSDPIALTSWRSHADTVRQRLAGTGEDDQRIDEGKCLMAWYIRAADGRERKVLDEHTTNELRAKWIADIAAYKSGELPAVP